MPTSALPRTTHGELAAAAACLLAQAAGEMESGRMGGIPNAKGGGLIAALVELQQATAGELDFAHLARTRAVRTLQERCGHDVSATRKLPVERRDQIKPEMSANR
jgi:hypothetical protein